MARKRWDSSIHNLELYRATKLERERRRQSHQSQNAEAARKDLQARRLGRFSNILNALDKPRPKRPDEADAEEGAGERHAPSSAPSRDDAPPAVLPRTLTGRLTGSRASRRRSRR